MKKSKTKTKSKSSIKGEPLKGRENKSRANLKGTWGMGGYVTKNWK